MKTVLFSSCYLNGLDGSGSNRYARTQRYLDYYYSPRVKEDLGFHSICLLDNGSNPGYIGPLKRAYPSLSFVSAPNLEGGRFQHDYPYCWRALFYIRDLIESGYDKIIFIDTDGFILSNTLASYVRRISSGWETFWCKKHGFPESAFHVLCKDIFPLFMEFTKGDFYEKNGKVMELVLPFTKVNKEFQTDRYGEDRLPQSPDMDYYGQAPLDVELKYQAWR